MRDRAKGFVLATVLAVSFVVGIVVGHDAHRNYVVDECRGLNGFLAKGVSYFCMEGAYDDGEE